MQKVELAPLDRVEVLSIMDNSVDVLMASTPVAKRPERARNAFERPQLRAEHGVSRREPQIDQQLTEPAVGRTLVLDRNAQLVRRDQIAREQHLAQRSGAGRRRRATRERAGWPGRSRDKMNRHGIRSKRES